MLQRLISACLTVGSMEDVGKCVAIVRANCMLPQDFSLSEFKIRGSCFGGTLVYRDKSDPSGCGPWMMRRCTHHTHAHTHTRSLSLSLYMDSHRDMFTRAYTANVS
jgi:hypothetical protein